MFSSGAVIRVLRLLRCKIIQLMKEVRDHPRNDSVVDCSCPELSELIV